MTKASKVTEEVEEDERREAWAREFMAAMKEQEQFDE